MITEGKVRQVSRLLQAGYKVRDVVEICGVAYRLVVRIKSGSTADELNADEVPWQKPAQAEADDDEDNPNPARRQLQVGAKEMLAAGYPIDRVRAVFGDVF